MWYTFWGAWTIYESLNRNIHIVITSVFYLIVPWVHLPLIQIYVYSICEPLVFYTTDSLWFLESLPVTAPVATLTPFLSSSYSLLVFFLFSSYSAPFNFSILLIPYNYTYDTFHLPCLYILPWPLRLFLSTVHILLSIKVFWLSSMPNFNHWNTTKPWLSLAPLQTGQISVGLRKMTKVEVVWVAVMLVRVERVIMVVLNNEFRIHLIPN